MAAQVLSLEGIETEISVHFVASLVGCEVLQSMCVYNCRHFKLHLLHSLIKSLKPNIRHHSCFVNSFFLGPLVALLKNRSVKPPVQQIQVLAIAFLRQSGVAKAQVVADGDHISSYFGNGVPVTHVVVFR